MATPVLRALKSMEPDCSITWLVDSRYADALTGNSLIDELISFNSVEWREAFRTGRLFSYLRQSLTLNRDLRRRHFDAVLNMTGEKWWSAWLITGRTNIGLFPKAKMGATARLYHRAVPRPAGHYIHNSDHYLAAVTAIGGSGDYDRRMVYEIPAGARESAMQFLIAHPAYDAALPCVVLHPGTSQQSKCWPVEQFGSVAAGLIGRANVIVTGSSSEFELARSVAVSSGRCDGIIVAAGVLKSLGETAAIVEQANVVVTGDTSMLHIASALDCPVIGIFGSTRPGNNAPLFGPSELLFDDSVPCAPCYLPVCPLKGPQYMRCHKSVTPAAVLTLCLAWLNPQTQEKSDPRIKV